MSMESQKFFVGEDGTVRDGSRFDREKKPLPTTPERFFVDEQGNTSSDLAKLELALTGEETVGSSLDDIITLEDLPFIWQEHIKERKTKGFMKADQNSFTKYEILKATSSEPNHTPHAIIDKLFSRIKKEKIDFVDLPEAWQERLKDKNVFGNFTVEYLKQLGALDKDIAKIKVEAEAKKVVSLKKDIERTATSFLNPKEAGRAFLNNVTEEEKPVPAVPVKKSWGSKVRSWLGL